MSHGARVIKERNVVHWETHQKRIVHAYGKDVFAYELTPWILNVDATDPTGWTTTVVEVGTGTTEFSANNTAGRTGTITCAADENDGGSYQLIGEIFEFTSDQDIYVGAELQVNDADQTDLLFGLCITDTAILGGVSDGVYFESVDGGAGISFVAEKDSTETQEDSLGTLADATDVILEFYWDGTSLEAFIDGASVYGPSTPANLPDDEALRLSIEFLTGEAVANTCDVKWMRAFQIGR